MFAVCGLSLVIGCWLVFVVWCGSVRCMCRWLVFVGVLLLCIVCVVCVVSCCVPCAVVCCFCVSVRGGCCLSLALFMVFVVGCCWLLLRVVWCLLFGDVCCLLFGVCCVWFVVRGLLFVRWLTRVGG